MSHPILTLRELNRATLARQLLLERAALSPVDAIERIGGLQAQEPPSPYVGLWSRLADFQAAGLHKAILDHDIVKASLFRVTLHLVSGADYPLVRAALETTFNQPRSDARWEAGHPQFAGWRDLALAHAADTPRSNAEMRDFLAVVAGDHADAVWWTLRWTSPFIHAPRDELWSYGRRPLHVDAVRWLGAEIPTQEAGARHLVLRYLRGLGPASIADIGRWAGISRGLVRESVAAIESSGSTLRRFRDADGRELLDIEDAPRPHGDVPAPVRFLPMWDNALLGYDDRRRISPDTHRGLMVRRNGDHLPAILVDGATAGVWITEPSPGGARVRWTLFDAVSPDDLAAVAGEAARLEAWLRPLDPDIYATYRRWFAPATGT